MRLFKKHTDKTRAGHEDVRRIQLTPFAEDPDSQVLYLGNASPIGAMLQGSDTDSGKAVLDLAFVVPQGDVGKEAHFVLRLETPRNEIVELARWLIHVIEHPVPSPSMEDLFMSALMPAEVRNKAGDMLPAFEEVVQAVRNGRAKHP